MFVSSHISEKAKTDPGVQSQPGRASSRTRKASLFLFFSFLFPNENTCTVGLNLGLYAPLHYPAHGHAFQTNCANVGNVAS